MKKIAVMIAVAAVILAGCEGTGQKQQMGTIIGAGLGALAGSQIGHGKGQLAAVAIGTLIGAGIGSEVGKSLDKADRLALEQANQKAFEYNPSGTAETWYNPDSGNSGSVVPKPAFKNSDGQYCREFTQTITVGGETHQGYGTACRQPDGSWKIVSN